MVEPAVPRSEIVTRLKKIEGQIRGIQNMVSQERECVDVMIQLSAVKSGLESVAAQIFRNYTSICLQSGEGEDVGANLSRAISIWVGGHG